MIVLLPAGSPLRQEILCSEQMLEEKTSLRRLVGDVGPDTLEHVEGRYLLLLGVQADRLRPLRHGGWAWKVAYEFQPLWLIDTDIETIDWRRLVVSS